MVILSVIIVNYNVKYFLEQCLCSLEKAIGANGQWSMVNGERAVEIFVVDNHSSDGSVDYLKSRFPEVQFIVNSENKGFGKANNQALKQARGRYVLFLNPDTILGEDSLEKCISFLEFHPESGAAGVSMIDGSGRFLKESKRGFPSPWAAFCKLSGLTGLFPRSRLFAAYYLGHLDEHETNPADVLSGAFMLVKKEALDKTGGFDERFFMYAEDIDLSYRIQQAGYKNYYIADTTIIHFKGESTQKDFRYVKLFYKAMSQFMRKHTRGGGSFIFILLMEAAIRVRAAMEAFRMLFGNKMQPVSSGNIKTFLSGNTDNTDLSKITSASRIIVQQAAEADEIIFCEGADLSFSKIIDSIRQQQPSSVAFKIHAARSRSIIGSHSKDRKGEVIVL